jgi:ATP-binding cassette, subfamily F, member 3
MLSLTQIDLQFGSRFLFRDLNLILQAGQRVGLVGKNGSGKTTLFSIMIGELKPDGGDVSIAKGIRVAYMQQELGDTTKTILDYVLAGDLVLTTVEAKIKRAEEKEAFEDLAHFYVEYDDAGGYTAKPRASEILHGLGFSDEELQKPLSDFSGGWRMRVQLARCLFTPSDLLLLDEPTNHLDLETIVWLEKWLKQYPGSLILVSHDRDFLDHQVSHVAVLENMQCQLFKGNYETYEKRRAEQLALQQTMHEKQQKHIAHMMDFVNRFRAKATKAKQAQSRLKAIEKIELIAAAHIDSGFDFSFKPAPLAGNPLLVLDKVTMGYQDKTVFNGLSFALNADDRIALLGVNGAGKSTLLKVLAGVLKVESGVVENNPKLKIGYFAQHQVEYLHGDETPMWHLAQLSPDEREQAFRQYLGGFGFSGDRAKSEVGVFSGGEKSRLALALMIWQQPNVLILDEPTNHLDIEMREALMMALQDFEGAMVIVSHDRHMLTSVTDKFYLIDQGKLNVFNGDLNDYEALVRERDKAEKPAKKPKKATSNKATSCQATLEREITACEKAITDFETQLAAPDLYNGDQQPKIDELNKHLHDARETLAVLETQWLDHQ